MSFREIINNPLMQKFIMSELMNPKALFLVIRSSNLSIVMLVYHAWETLYYSNKKLRGLLLEKNVYT